MKGEDISVRLLDFAVRVIRLVLALPTHPVARHVGGQLTRCGTAAGANYEEARGGSWRRKPCGFHSQAGRSVEGNKRGVLLAEAGSSRPAHKADACGGPASRRQRTVSHFGQVSSDSKEARRI